MSYIALYRKYRPKLFDDVRGQDSIVKSIQYQVREGRIGHAYLLSGTRGCGKTTVAKIMAKAVNCTNSLDGNPCNECSSCRDIDSGATLNVVEMDAASNRGIDSIREIVEGVEFSPQGAKYRVYIIDEVHMLTNEAFNAFLKTLEEPPEYVIFILATTEPHKIPITILSRCLRYEFKRMGVGILCDQLKAISKMENIDIDDDAMEYIANAADGAMRDAISILDKCRSHIAGERLTLDILLDILGVVDDGTYSKLFSCCVTGDVLSCIKIIDEVLYNGRELTWFVGEYVRYLRNVLITIASSDDVSQPVVSKEDDSIINKDSQLTDMSTICRYIRIMSQLLADIRYSETKRIALEVALIKLCKPQMQVDMEALIGRINAIECKIEELSNGVSNGVIYKEGTIDNDRLSRGYNDNQDVARIREARCEYSDDNVDNEKETETRSTEVISNKVHNDVDIKGDNELEGYQQVWSKVIANAGMPLKLYLKQARVSSGSKDSIILEYDSITSPGYGHFNPPDDIKEQQTRYDAVTAEVSKYANRPIEVIVRVRKQHEEDYKKDREPQIDIVSRMAAANINVDIEIEEEE